MYAYTNILAALMQRGKTGRGCANDISMLECMVEWMNYPLYYALDGAAPPPRAGASHATIYPYGPFHAGDGKTVMLGLQNEREWAVFCAQVLQQPKLATDPRFASNSQRVAARRELCAIIEQAFAQLTSAQVIEKLDAAQIANAHLNDMHDVWQHAQLKARRRWVDIDTPAGSVPALLPPGLPNAYAPRMDAVPALGEHTEAILAALGYGSDDIARLRAHSAI
jgi:itaconate CoA-transferase